MATRRIQRTVTRWMLPWGASADVKSAIQLHVETFGTEAVEIDPPILEAFMAETGVSFCCRNCPWMRRFRKSSGS